MAISQIVHGGDRAEMPSFRTLARRSWWLIAVCVIVGAVAGGAYSATGKKAFGSTVQVEITPTVDVHLGVQPSKQLVNLDTETAVIRSDDVLQEFAKSVGSIATPEALRKNVKVTPVSGFAGLSVTYKASSGSKASSGVVGILKVYLARRHDAVAAEVVAEKATLAGQLASAQASAKTLGSEVAALDPNASRANRTDAAVGRREKLTQELNAATAQVTQLQSRQKQLDRIVITPGKIDGVPTKPKASLPPWPLFAAAGGLVGLFFGFAAAAFRERRADSRSALRLARAVGASVLVSFSGPAEATSDVEDVFACLDLRPGSVAATTAVGRASSAKLARGLAELSARWGTPTVIVYAAAGTEVSGLPPIVPAPLGGEEAVEAAVAVEGVERLSTFVVNPNDPGLLGDAFFTALKSLARSKDCVVIFDAPPMNGAWRGQVALRHTDAAVIVTTSRLSRRTVHDIPLLDERPAQVVVASV